MKRPVCVALTAVVLCLWLTWPAAANSDSRKVDGLHSTMTVRVYKSGFLSAFGHNHEIQAAIQSGEIKESGSPSVELRVDAQASRVRPGGIGQHTSTNSRDNDGRSGSRRRSFPEDSLSIYWGGTEGPRPLDRAWQSGIARQGPPNCGRRSLLKMTAIEDQPL